MSDLVRPPYEDFRAPVIAALCAALGIPFADVAEVEPGRYSPRVRIDLNPAVPGNGMVTYAVGEGGWVTVRGDEVERIGLDPASWDPPMVADDATVRDALATAHKGLFGDFSEIITRCTRTQWRDHRMNYPQYPEGEAPPEDTMHPDIRQALRSFAVDHLPDDLRAVAQPFRDLALMMADELPADPEVTRGLHKLVESKDCAVRAVVFNRAAP